MTEKRDFELEREYKDGVRNGAIYGVWYASLFWIVFIAILNWLHPLSN